MTTAAVQATVVTLLTLMATWTGLLMAVALLLPAATQVAEHHLQTSKVRSFLLGLGLLTGIAIGFSLFRAGSPVARLLGFASLELFGALLVLGAAGIAQLIGRRGEPEVGQPNFRNLLRGSLTLSLAMGFPFIGWFLFAPLAVVFALGAGLLAVWPERRLAPKTLPPVISGGGPTKEGLNH
ncbi:hypothetical protein CWRG_00311 [Chthonomonas calidirosea]|uniref:hypothetical protein n=1 Tax=Chthonomonas calidirosea TaxID=454171 RepID=UPI0006DD3B3A|nr:hypothetical protein [Chthonomonas calidirosea]CEK13005.1 hypothetical protein CWRG_00311 [Chthonomonas calidirosea]